MCDYSLQSVKTRPAAVGDKLTTKSFGTGTRGFAAAEDCGTAVCVLPGTEIAFDAPIKVQAESFSWMVPGKELLHSTAIFRQINTEHKHMHHDALETPDGDQYLLTALVEGQSATVLQLPAAPRTEAEAKAQTRLEVVG